VISNLGGTPQNVTCPWCSGTGRRQVNIDAQAAWRERQKAEGVAAGSAPEGSPPADSSSEAGEPQGEEPGAQAPSETSA